MYSYARAGQGVIVQEELVGKIVEKLIGELVLEMAVVLLCKSC